MENLIKTKKLETRFFLTTAAQQAASGGQVSKPQPVAGTITKGKPGSSQGVPASAVIATSLNSTAPINFHNIAIMGGLGPGNNGVLAGGRGPGTAVGGSRGNSSSSNNG